MNKVCLGFTQTHLTTTNSVGSGATKQRAIKNSNRCTTAETERTQAASQLTLTLNPDDLSLLSRF